MHALTAIPTRAAATTNTLITTVNDQAWTDSLLLAEKFNKQHGTVLRAIRNLECSDEFSRCNFALAGYIDEQGKSRPIYRISRDGFSMLAMGFTGKEAARWKEKFIGAFNTMERHILKEATERNLVRDDTKASIKHVGFALVENRAEAGKATPAHIHSNEARMLNTIMNELFGMGDRSSRTKAQLKVLDKLQRMDSHLISKGLPYQQRKVDLHAYGKRVVGDVILLRSLPIGNAI